MRPPLVAGNWKMNKTIVETRELISAMAETLNKIKNAHVVVLDEHGKTFSSQQFATQLQDLEQFHQLVFIIGGPLGLSESILKLAKLKLSLSTLTFTHQMARVFLLEQVYRAMMINMGKKYHY